MNSTDSRNLKLSKALLSKICHDLSGSIGNIDNCLDLLSNSDQNISREAGIVAKNESGKLVNNIKFFRAVYGGGNFGDKINKEQLENLLDIYLPERVITKLSMFDENLNLNAQIASLIVGFAGNISDSVIGKGELNISIAEEGAEIILDIKAAWIVELNKILSRFSKQIEPDVNNCMEQYLQDKLENLGYNIYIEKIAQHHYQYIFKRIKI